MSVTSPRFKSLRGVHFWKYENYICSLCVAAQYPKGHRKPVRRPSLERATSPFSTTTCLSGSGYWSQAPSVRQKVLNSRARPATPAVIDKDNKLASGIANLGIFKSAVSTGVIAVSADKAAQILKDFQALPNGAARAAGIPGRAQVASLCSEHRVKPLLLCVLGLLLVRGTDAKSIIAKQARKLIYAASAAGDATATIYLCSAALQGEKRGEMLRTSREHLFKLVEEGHNAQVMVLAGHIAAREGDYKRALELYEKGVELGKNEDRRNDTTENIYAMLASHDASVSSGLRDGWRSLGNLRMAMGDRKGGKEALEQGAEMQDPSAFFFLQEYEDQKSKKWFEYVTKAAASGIADASLMLGNFYLKYETVGWEQLDNGKLVLEPNYRKRALQEGEERIEAIEHLNPLERRKMAVSWFEVGAWIGHGESILALIKCLLEHGQAKDAEWWMTKFNSCDDEKSKTEAQRLMEVERTTGRNVS